MFHCSFRTVRVSVGAAYRTHRTNNILHACKFLAIYPSKGSDSLRSYYFLFGRGHEATLPRNMQREYEYERLYGTVET